MLYRASTKRMDRKWPRSKAQARFSERSKRYDSRWICALSVPSASGGSRQLRRRHLHDIKCSVCGLRTGLRDVLSTVMMGIFQRTAGTDVRYAQPELTRENPARRSKSEEVGITILFARQSLRPTNYRLRFMRGLSRGGG